MNAWAFKVLRYIWKRQILLPFTATIFLMAGCEANPSYRSSVDGGNSYQRQRFLLDTNTHCTTDGYVGIETGTMLAEIDEIHLVAGFDDELLSGFDIPIMTSSGHFSTYNLKVMTDEMYGVIHLISMNGIVTRNSLTLEYNLQVLDITCRLTGEGQRTEE